MPNIQLPQYDEFRNWIKKRRAKNVDWEKISYACKENQMEFKTFFQAFVDIIDPGNDMDIDTWAKIVESEKEFEQRSIELKAASEAGIIIDPLVQKNNIGVPQDLHSSWQLYRKHLEESGWKIESIDEVESSTVDTLRLLSKDTTTSGPIKGLVIGHVQSGKTANMAALMAMAGDWGWNMFIILSGTIENLRKQTQRRLNNDLNKVGSLSWISLEHPSILGSPIGQRLQDLNLGENSNSRYFTVCLKNSTRLEHLIGWMNSDPNKCRQLKVIIVDDESDQAGVNTSDITKEERTSINRLIVNLVASNKVDGSVTDLKPHAMNYIGYTATPYANFLNESFFESLYPRHFIRTLRPSDEYFGPRQIFGLMEDEDCDGLDIIRPVSDLDLSQIKEIHSGKSTELPMSLKESVAWFLCSVSAMRLFNYKKPISMLIHASQRQQHHQKLADAISKWMLYNQEVKNVCMTIWEREKERFTLEAFREQFSAYGREDTDIHIYPDFTQIESGIHTLITKLTHIQMDQEGNLTYHDGIHLCIDNCANNGVNSEGMVVRLVYPEMVGMSYLSKAPAFIVIGGNTLSRGLTLEGLVSTYFIRSSNNADTLMQMGRWFGYRRNYELYPRIWMTLQCLEKFKFLTRLEQDLRYDLKRFMEMGFSPAAYGPRVLNSPKVSWLRITSIKKMQGAVPDEMDFTGTSSQTVIFDNDVLKLKGNIETTSEFINNFGEPGIMNREKTALVWYGIKFDDIEEKLFKPFHFAESGRVFNQIDSLCKWYRESMAETGFTDWNVVVAGIKQADNKTDAHSWQLPGGVIWKVNRSKQKNTKDDIISIGVLRAPKDLIADVDFSKLSSQTIERIHNKPNNLNAESVREEAGLSKTPQLIIYRIDKNSKARNKDGVADVRSIAKNKSRRTEREDLKAPEDIIGISILIPGVKSGTSFAKKLTVRINPEDIDKGTEMVEME